ncbi:ABC transporter ATP-binding protein [Periweissella cryptocerci]|uniref:ABC transporter ATP-binding protein n=1 Tax=Periweissella cryptocerci TaxID=2506420 RepID=A0A4P6YR28_9LACO|nr:ABC transporter ATP-binding protein [Periweissella cryptocerci]QBO35064.1 ABC transporter ATP-binding protein [Periweissella cryptocerci]
MIELKHVNKMYGQQAALKDLNLSIKSGQIFGLLGHNGAGKSTVIKSLVSIIQPTHGSIEFDGVDLATERLAIKRRIGYVADSPDIFLQLTPNEYWQLIGAAYELAPDYQAKRLDELVTLFDLNGKENETIAEFSHGMREKTMIIGALLSDPDIWILDEPIQGLDPQAAFDLKALMKAHAAKGKTVIFSTHVLDTAQEICDEIAILKKGELIYNGTMTDLLATQPTESLETIYLQMAGRHGNDAATMASEALTHE